MNMSFSLDVSCYIERENGDRNASDVINVCRDDVRLYCNSNDTGWQTVEFMVEDTPETTDPSDVGHVSQCSCRLAYHESLVGRSSSINAQFDDSLCVSADDVTNRRSVCSYRKALFEHTLHVSFISYGVTRLLNCESLVTCTTGSGSLIFRGNDDASEVQLGVSFGPADLYVLSLGKDLLVIM